MTTVAALPEPVEVDIASVKVAEHDVAVKVGLDVVRLDLFADLDLLVVIVVVPCSTQPDDVEDVAAVATLLTLCRRAKGSLPVHPWVALAEVDAVRERGDNVDGGSVSEVLCTAGAVVGWPLSEAFRSCSGHRSIAVVEGFPPPFVTWRVDVEEEVE